MDDLWPGDLKILREFEDATAGFDWSDDRRSSRRALIRDLPYRRRAGLATVGRQGVLGGPGVPLVCPAIGGAARLRIGVGNTISSGRSALLLKAETIGPAAMTIAPTTRTAATIASRGSNCSPNPRIGLA
jgi:hypothetical protein